MPPKHDQENQPTSSLDTPDTNPPARLPRKSARKPGEKVLQLDEVPLNAADTTIPAKRGRNTKHGKGKNQQANPASDVVPPPTQPLAPKERSNPTAGKKPIVAPKQPPSAAAAPPTQPSTASAGGRTKPNNPAPGPKTKRTLPEDTDTSAQLSNSHTHRGTQKGIVSKSQSSPSDASAATTTVKAKTASRTPRTPTTRKEGTKGPRGSTSKATGASNSDPELHKELETLRAQLARANKKLKKASESTNKSKVKAIEPQPLIPRLSGMLGKDWRLQTAMGLVQDKPLYTKILSDVRKLVIKAGLDTSKGIRKQDPVKLGAIYEIARDKRPLLTQFENDWATSQIIIQYLANVRRSSSEADDNSRSAKPGRLANREGSSGNRSGKHPTRDASPEAIGRLQAARAVLGVQRPHMEDDSSSSDDDDERRDAMDVDDDDDAAENEGSGADQDEEQDEGAEEGAEGAGRAGAPEDDGDEEEEDDVLDVPPAKRRKVALVLPEDE
ncbi:hypothetical protein GSI_06480 [Ganoderma sinense ZZ0214-1]|uniref:Uncharacterized protein n=1 Tax=Ganoderma sinense ZZ0214-1 TaxID=1077348 RepID=A0A2G8SDC4_9APHY|nr:hypothetical protein GSI_06480 [Ganoderma sinense ZZ0214-1]